MSHAGHRSKKQNNRKASRKMRSKLLYGFLLIFLMLALETHRTLFVSAAHGNGGHGDHGGRGGNGDHGGHGNHGGGGYSGGSGGHGNHGGYRGKRSLDYPAADEDPTIRVYEKQFFPVHDDAKGEFQEPETVYKPNP